jgi:hypothetical protein
VKFHVKRRVKPYTDEGIRRARCAFHGCKERGHAQWNACALKTETGLMTYWALCKKHDVALNELAVRFVFGVTPEIETKLKDYRLTILGD